MALCTGHAIQTGCYTAADGSQQTVLMHFEYYDGSAPVVRITDAAGTIIAAADQTNTAAGACVETRGVDCAETRQRTTVLSVPDSDPSVEGDVNLVMASGFVLSFPQAAGLDLPTVLAAWVTAIQALLPDATVTSFGNAVQIENCASQDYVASATYQSNTGGVLGIIEAVQVGQILGDIVRYNICRECGQDPIWRVDGTDTVVTEPECWLPCGFFEQIEQAQQPLSICDMPFQQLLKDCFLDDVNGNQMNMVPFYAFTLVTVKNGVTTNQFLGNFTDLAMTQPYTPVAPTTAAAIGSAQKPYFGRVVLTPAPGATEIWNVPMRTSSVSITLATQTGAGSTFTDSFNNTTPLILGQAINFNVDSFNLGGSAPFVTAEDGDVVSIEYIQMGV